MKWCFKKTAISVKNAREVYRRPVAERVDCADGTIKYKIDDDIIDDEYKAAMGSCCSFGKPICYIYYSWFE